MKIAVLSNLYPPQYLGGFEILCDQISRKLYENGHDIFVLASDHNNPAIQSNDTVPFSVERTLKLYVPFSQPAKLMRHKRSVTSKYNYKIAKSFFERNEPDIVFVWSQLRLTLGAAYAAQDCGIPCAYTFNDEYISSFAPARFSWNTRQMIRFLLDNYIYPQITLKKLNLTMTTSISLQVKKNLQAANVPIPNSSIIYQGIPIEKFTPKKNIGSLNAPLSILYVGQVHHYKGVHTIIESLTILKSKDFPKFTLTVVGDGPEEYKKMLHEKSKSLSVQFLGKITHDKLPEIYRAHDIFIFPSIWQEPFGLTHIEAMASGTVVISTNDGGHGEFLKHLENAYVFMKNNPTDLASKLEQCVSNPEITKKIALHARKMVEEGFTSDIYASNLEKFLETSLEEFRQ